MTECYVGRTAPSASGLPHVGTVYSAWLAKERARNVAGEVWARIDDLDVARVRPETMEALLEALDLLGYPEHHIVRQSERMPLYERALDKLADQGALYHCLCSKARIRALGQALVDGGFGYDNACRHRSLDKTQWRMVPGSVRANLSGVSCQVFVDGQAGPLSLGLAGDPVVRRRDGVIAYTLASVVDDHALRITEIVRGRDLLGVLGAQALLCSRFGTTMPAIAHHRLWLRADGNKLSKSVGDGARWSRTLAREWMDRFAWDASDAAGPCWVQPDAVWQEEEAMPRNNMVTTHRRTGSPAEISS